MILTFYYFLSPLIFSSFLSPFSLRHLRFSPAITPPAFAARRHARIAPYDIADAA
jgi:hypothetical protein